MSGNLRDALEKLLVGREGLIMVDTAELRNLLNTYPAEAATCRPAGAVVGCGSCEGLPGKMNCPTCHGTGRFPAEATP